MKIINQLTRVLKAYYITFIGYIFGKEINIPSNKNILIVSPHPDDEIFGCGNIIHKYITNNNNVSVVILSKGENSTQLINKDELIRNRREMAIQANSLVGCNDITFLDFPDSNFSQIKVNDNEAQKLLNEVI